MNLGTFVLPCRCPFLWPTSAFGEFIFFFHVPIQSLACISSPLYWITTFVATATISVSLIVFPNGRFNGFKHSISILTDLGPEYWENVLSALNNRKNACQIITTQPKIKTYFPMPLISRSSSFVLGILLLMCCSVALLHGNKEAYQEKYSNRWLLSNSAWLKRKNLKAHPNMWYAITPSPASFRRAVRSIRRAENSLADRFCHVKSLIDGQGSHQSWWMKRTKTQDISIPSPLQIEVGQDYQLAEDLTSQTWVSLWLE